MRSIRFLLASFVSFSALCARAEDPDSAPPEAFHSFKEEEAAQGAKPAAAGEAHPWEKNDVFSQVLVDTIDEAMGKFKVQPRKVTRLSGNLVFHEKGARWVQMPRYQGCIVVSPQAMCAELNKKDRKGKWVPASSAQLKENQTLIADMERVHRAIEAQQLRVWMNALPRSPMWKPSPEALAAMQRYREGQRDFCFEPRPTADVSDAPAPETAVSADQVRKSIEANQKLGFPSEEPKDRYVYCVSQK